jgi:hypothetical protein
MTTPQPGPPLVVERPPVPARISADPCHPWYDPRARQLRVHVNGERLLHCTRADTVAGHAWTWVCDEAGSPQMEYGRPVERLHVGRVELLWKPAGPDAGNDR